MNYGIFNRPTVTIYEIDAPTKQTLAGEVSTVSDEGFYGSTCKILAGPGGLNCKGNTLSEDMVEIITSYGYHGYAYKEDLVFAREAKLRSWINRKFCLVSRSADVLTAPSVTGVRLITLVRGNVIEVLPERAPDADSGSTLPLHVDGWQRVRLIDERVGYIRDTSLKAKVFSRSTVFYLDGEHTLDQALAMGQGIDASQVVEYVQNKFYGGDEVFMREKIIETALAYLGTEYRWGGKTTTGIDCSGLVSTAYMQNGILIYRDAKIMDGWAIKEIDRANIKPADLIYFPGHVALYLGQGRYLHATGAANSGGVVVNSLLPNDPLFRQDLFDSITACGSAF